MRIRLLFILLLLLPVAAWAGPSVTQQDGWSLRTSTNPKMTKDYFCASESSFSNGYKMILARNILGQTSIILTWPGINGNVGSTIPVRITVDKKALRDAQANLKAPGMLVIPLGWDDAALQQMAAGDHINFSAAKTEIDFTLRDNGKAFTRLTSCTASLIDRLPASSNLNADVSKTLNKAGLAHTKALEVNDDKNASADNFIVDNIFGGSALLSEGNSDVTQRMLEYVDQLELLCRANFTSELGAPTPTADGEVTTAEAQCDSAHTGTVTALAFVKDGRKTRVYYFESDKDRMQQVKALRDMITKSFD